MSGSGSLAHYEVRVEGVLGPQWAAWFGNLQLDSDGRQTVISGQLDQAALHGVLSKVRDLGLRLIAVYQVDPRENTNPGGGVTG